VVALFGVQKQLGGHSGSPSFMVRSFLMFGCWLFLGVFDILFENGLETGHGTVAMMAVPSTCSPFLPLDASEREQSR